MVKNKLHITYIMEKRLNRKINTHSLAFKNEIKTKMQSLDLLDNQQVRELLQFVYDYPVLEITKIDLQKRKRVMKALTTDTDMLMLTTATDN